MRPIRILKIHTQIENRIRAVFQRESHSLLPLALLVQRQAVNLVQLLTTQHGAAFRGHFQRTTLHHQTRGSDDMSLFVLGTGSLIRQRSVFFDGVRHFNRLPMEIRAVRDSRAFKKMTKAWFLAELPRLATTAMPPISRRWTNTTG